MATIKFNTKIAGAKLTAIAIIHGWTVDVPNPAFDKTKPVDALTNPATIPNPRTSVQGGVDYLVSVFKNIIAHEVSHADKINNDLGENATKTLREATLTQLTTDSTLEII